MRETGRGEGKKTKRNESLGGRVRGGWVGTVEEQNVD